MAEYALARRILKTVFNLEPEIVDKVIRTIKNSPDAIDLRSAYIHRHMGPQATNYLKQALDHAKETGEEDKTPSWKHKDKEDSDKSAPKKDKKGKKEVVKESFIDYIVELDARAAARINTLSQDERRERSRKTDQQQRQDNAEEMTDMESSSIPEEKQYAMLLKKMAQLKQIIARKKEQAGAV